MRNLKTVTLLAVIVAVQFVVTAPPAWAQQGLSQSDASAAPTDSMTPYRTTAADILQAFKAGNMDTAIAKSKEIQKAWDGEQKALKARAKDVWKAADHAMDLFVKPIIKDDNLDATKVQGAYDAYISTLDAAAKS
jgi:hypothetical protein